MNARGRNGEMCSVVRNLADNAVIGTDYLLHALLDTDGAVALLARIHNCDGIGGCIVCTVKSIKIRRSLRLLLNFGLGLDLRQASCIAVREHPIGRTSYTGGRAVVYASTGSIGFHIF